MLGKTYRKTLTLDFEQRSLCYSVWKKVKEKYCSEVSIVCLFKKISRSSKFREKHEEGLKLKSAFSRTLVSKKLKLLKSITIEKST